MNSICKTLYDCCENHSNCSCTCKNLKLIYFNYDELFRRRPTQKSVDCLRYPSVQNILYMVEIKNQPIGNIRKKQRKKIEGKIKDTFRHLKRNNINYNFKFYLAISDSKNTSINQIHNRLKMQAIGLFRPYYMIYTHKIDNRVIKCSQTDTILK